MYGYGYSYGYGLIGGNTYNPLINYDWSTTTTSGLRYLKDVGSTPSYNASMYFGRGAYLNGVDQTITAPINATIQTALKRVNGVITINEASQILTNYVISGLGVHKDYYLFTRLLTTAEKDSYTNTPELFYAMAQADSDCVLNMPMCETDGYVRDMKSYSKGANLTTNGTFDTLTGWSLNTNALAGVTNTNNTLNYSNSHGDYAETKQPNKSIVGMYYLVIFDVVSKIDSAALVYFQFGRTSLPSGAIISGITTGTKIAVVQATHTDGFSISVMSNGIIEIDNVKTYQLSGIYPVTNYTTSVRDNAKNLRHGLQTCKFVRDGLGVIQSASDYLECDGIGYADTGWIPKLGEPFAMEAILYNDGTNSVFTRFGRAVGLSTGFVYFQRFSTRTYIRIFDKTLDLNPSIGYNKIVGYYDGVNIIKGYLNGVLVNTATLGTPSNDPITTFTLGKVNGQTGDEWKTPIASFKVHNKLLTNEEIQAL